MLSGLQLQILFILSREVACKSKETTWEQSVSKDRAGERHHWNPPPDPALHSRAGQLAWTHAPSHLLPSQPQLDLGSRCLVQIPALRQALPGCFASTSLTVLSCTPGIILSILGVSEDIIKSCSGLGSSASYTVKPSLTIPPFYLIATNLSF